MTTPIKIITDGASRGNPGPGGWAALIVRNGQIEELGGHVADTTNNRMELLAAVEALRRVPSDAPVELVTDSQYLLRGATEWLPGWRRRGWLTREGTPVEHRDLWEQLERLAGARVTWQHVRGHSGDPLNERADQIAHAYATGKQPPPAASQTYTPDTELLTTLTAQRPATTTYLSLVNGALQRHTTWEQCRRRVHGVSGARYKKCKSAADEVATVAGWGLPDAALLDLGK